MEESRYMALGRMVIGLVIVMLFVLLVYGVWVLVDKYKSENMIALYQPQKEKKLLNALSRAEHLAGLSTIASQQQMINRLVSEMNYPAEHMMVLEPRNDEMPKLFSTGMTEKQFVDNVMSTIGRRQREDMYSGTFPVWKPKKEITKLRALSLM